MASHPFLPPAELSFPPRHRPFCPGTSVKMTGVLKLSATLSPFPFAAAAVATYTRKAELAFEEGARLSLDLNGSTLSTEDEVVQALAKEGGLSDDSAKVRVSDRLSIDPTD